MFSLATNLSLAPTNLLENDWRLFTAREEIDVELSAEQFIPQGSKAKPNELHLIQEETSIYTKCKIQRLFSMLFCCKNIKVSTLKHRS